MKGVEKYYLQRCHGNASEFCDGDNACKDQLVDVDEDSVRMQTDSIKCHEDEQNTKLKNQKEGGQHDPSTLLGHASKKRGPGGGNGFAAHSRMNFSPSKGRYLDKKG